MKKNLFNIVGTALTVGALALSANVDAAFNFGKCCDEDNNNSECCDDARFSVHADVLFMEACQDSHSSTTVVIGATAPVLNGLGSETDHSNENDWDVGFRVGGHYRSACNGWDLNADYTYYSTDADSKRTEPVANVVAVEGSIAAGETGLVAHMHGVNSFVVNEAVLASTLTSKSELDYNMLDIAIGYNCCLCDGLEIRPNIGFRALWVDQEASNKASGILSETTDEDYVTTGAVLTTPATDGQFRTVDYEGYGLRGALNWQFTPECSPFAVFGGFGVSALVGENKDSSKIVAASIVVDSHKETNSCATNFGVDTQVGLRFDHCTCGYNFHVAAGYELTYWDSISGAFSDEDGLTLHGAFVRLGVDF
jgi:hypothetical protein